MCRNMNWKSDKRSKNNCFRIYSKFMALCIKIHGILYVVLALLFHRFNAQVTIIKSGPTQLKLPLKTAISYSSEKFLLLHKYSS